MFIRYILKTSAWLFLVTMSVNSLAKNYSHNPDGITLSNTRIIYPGDARNGVTYTLTNNTAYPYLLQSRVLPYSVSSSDIEMDEALPPPFIVLPPLSRIEPDTTITLRIRLTQNSLPQDRESVFWMMLNAIPAQTEIGTGQTRLVMSTQNNLKLFYRPADLPEPDDASIAKQQEFKLNGNTLTVQNPTPFYITFSSISVGDIKLDLQKKRMVAPFSELTWLLPTNTNGELRWQLITDDGRPGKVIIQPAG
ncbi:molecular chaperone [Morganella morganii]|uniref:fimbrial biogenesis chaperone n=1 Tax=Morganella morganii TaxID=582 RepID=UPI0031B4E3E4